jgi:hypothetical protein
VELRGSWERYLRPVEYTGPQNFIPESCNGVLEAIIEGENTIIIIRRGVAVRKIR